MTQKLTLLCMLLGLTILGIKAQTDPNNRRLSISGQLLDADLKEPMVQATIQLFHIADSTFAGGTVSDVNGDFEVEA